MFLSRNTCFGPVCKLFAPITSFGTVSMVLAPGAMFLAPEASPLRSPFRGSYVLGPGINVFGPEHMLLVRNTSFRPVSMLLAPITCFGPEHIFAPYQMFLAAGAMYLPRNTF